MADRMQDGRSVRIVTGLDESTRECLASVGARRMGSPAGILVVAER